MTQLDLEALRTWIGRTQRSVDVVTSRLVASLRATLNHGGVSYEADAPSVPHCIHWCLAPELTPVAKLDKDGHGVRGEFLPPVPLQRRMWAGGDVVFHDSLRLGDEVERRAQVQDVRLRPGSTGTLCFVTVRHDLSTSRGLAVSERQDIVFRDQISNQVTGRQISNEAPQWQWQRRVQCDPILLFRYSALTFNSHRIHYDADYCREQECYPGLLVQGPLQASLLLDFAASIRGQQSPRSFSFRSTAPLFAGTAQLGASDAPTGLQLAVTDEQGRQTMMASASW
jgi:3-methylfumaryl-CoA hydratase